MKKIYQKPNLKSVKLISESALLQASNFNMGGTIEGDTSQALSNEEGKHDIWGNEGNGIW
ncbi:hypothetical protein [Bacteroides sp. OF04-15BH]|uniref:hypothetical protein n=1 Tax=Bacteroides sp. OF04-15BH TaxID=2292281 RepID=UPI000E4FF88D|nr:hypothetical protein [Bacteroides sp. OF04-15BH]RHP60288.1 hypothetical protein DXA74_14845 [Bacteroides sp. OF04-15BH]